MSETTNDEGRHVQLPTKRSNSVKRFCRKVRIARGNTCENCGAGVDDCQIESHHILTFYEYPEFEKDEKNILVLCQPCHSGLTTPYGQRMHEALIHWAQLKPELRQRVADYVEEKAPELTTFIRVVRAGESAADKYYFKNL